MSDSTGRPRRQSNVPAKPLPARTQVPRPVQRTPLTAWLTGNVTRRAAFSSTQTPEKQEIAAGLALCGFGLSVTVSVATGVAVAVWPRLVSLQEGGGNNFVRALLRREKFGRRKFRHPCKSQSLHCLTHTLHCQTPQISPGETSPPSLKTNFPTKLSPNDPPV